MRKKQVEEKIYYVAMALRSWENLFELETAFGKNLSLWQTIEAESVGFLEVYNDLEKLIMDYPDRGHFKIKIEIEKKTQTEIKKSKGGRGKK